MKFSIEISFGEKENYKCALFKENKTAYDIVSFLNNNLKKIKFDKTDKKEIKFKNIINLHDEEGISIGKVKELAGYIKSGNIILEKKIPNIKMVKINNKLILFDGHHSLLAYMLTHKKFDKIPHLVVDGELKSRDILVFFGKHKEKIEQPWENYVVNWFAPEEKQLCKRKRKNILELFQVVSKNI